MGASSDPTSRRPQVRRRPSGEPAPLPRKPLAGSGKVWLPLGLVVLVAFALLISPTDFVLGRGAFWDSVDQAIVDRTAEIRTAVLTDVAQALNLLVEGWFLRVVRWAVVAVLVYFKRWRHLFAFVGLVLVMQPALFAVSNRLARPRPDGIEILASWAEFASPSLPVIALTLTMVGSVYALATARYRRTGLLVTSIVVVAVVAARIYLAVDRMTDGVTGAILAAASAILVFRVLTPEAVFPVSYSRGKTAHLDMTNRRKTAILGALRDQLGLAATDLRLFGLEASGGSSPLLISLAGDKPRYVFGKLYAQNHLRSDRWYKFGRTLLYGALEDERPFRTVRALAEHEDYLMRLMADAGVPGPAPRGIVEITRGREYLVVTDFVSDASEMSEASVNAEVIDAGLGAVRAMWDYGLAHRDIKPGNILVKDDEIFLIDVAFGETRPTPWREAVDLANMMLTLSLRSAPDEVYSAAQRHFTDDEIAEALAATRGVTIPSELKQAIRDDPRDLLGDLRRLAPSRAPIRIQRWTPRRIAVLLVAIGLGLIAGWLIILNLAIVGNLL